MKKINVIVKITKHHFIAYAENMTSDKRHGDTWSNVKRNFKNTTSFSLHGDYKFKFRLNLASLFETYPFFNIRELAKYMDLNPTLLYQYKDGEKLPSEKRSLYILTKLQEIGHNLIKFK